MVLQLASGSDWGGRLPFESALRPLDSVASFVSQMFFGVFRGTFYVFGFIFFVVVSRLLIRRTAIADIAVSILIGAVSLPNVLPAAANALAFYLTVWELRRFGLLATLTSLVAGQLVWTVPLILPSWYAGRAVVAVSIPSAISAWALWMILSAQRRPLTESVA